MGSVFLGNVKCGLANCCKRNFLKTLLGLIICVAASSANKEYWWMNENSLFQPSNNVGGGVGSFQSQGSGGCGGNGGGCGGNNGGGFQSHSSGGGGGCGGGRCGGNNGNNQHSSGGGWNNNNGQGSSNNNRVVDPQPLRTPAPKRRPAPSRNNGCGGGGYGGGGNCGNNLPSPTRPDNGAAVVQTECPSGSKCVAEHFCDANGVMSNSRVSLTQYEKDQRGQMISCMMNQNTGSWGICCGIPANRQPSRPSNNNNFNNQNQQPSRPSNNNYNPSNNNQNRQPSRPSNNNFNNQNRQPSNNNNFNNQNNGQQNCPSVNNLPPVEACAGRSSNCWSVGQADVDCPGNALCCFDGCANTCQGGGGPAPRQPSQSNIGSANVGQGVGTNQQQIPQTQPVNTQVTQSRPQNSPTFNKPQKQTPIQSYPAVP